MSQPAPAYVNDVLRKLTDPQKPLPRMKSGDLLRALEYIAENVPKLREKAEAFYRGSNK